MRKFSWVFAVLCSTLYVEGCPSCEEGEGSTCKLVSGLFMKSKLALGYNHITTIPVGACSINITLIRPSSNRLALGETNGELFLNPTSSNQTATGLQYAAGTTLYYYRGDHKSREQILGEGPLTSSLDLQLFVSEPNLGVEYKFMFPMEQAQDLGQDLVRSQYSASAVARSKYKTRHKGRYSWTLKMLTVCSRSCGGGYQTTVAVCIRSSIGKVVPDSRCPAADKPVAQIVRCNRSPCPPGWSAGQWGACSRTCGDGLQERQVVCQQEFSPSMQITVSETACEAETAPASRQPCNLGACIGGPAIQMLATDPLTYRSSNSSSVYQRRTSGISRSLVTIRPPLQPPTEWIAQPWSPCSVSCGQGVKERRVHCVDKRGGLVPDSRCENLARPDSEGFCDMGPCLTNKWFVSDWEQCTAHCGEGVQTRRVHCIGDCTGLEKPVHQRNCSASRRCKGEWFTGRWSVCSQSCGVGQQNREVVCTLRKEDFSAGRRLRHQVVTEDLCQHRRRPRQHRKCEIQPCKPAWFTTQWSECSVSCGEGVATRDVACIYRGKVSVMCGDTKPSNSKKCKVECGGKEEMSTDTSTEEQEEETEWEEYDEFLDEPEFRDVDPVFDEEEEENVPVAESVHSTSTPNRKVVSNDILPEKPVKRPKQAEGEVCRDKFKNCNIVVQSRLCRYSFYQTNCCESCTLTLP